MTLLEAIEYCDRKSHGCTPEAEINFEIRNLLDELRLRRLQEKSIESQTNRLIEAKFSLKK